MEGWNLSDGEMEEVLYRSMERWMNERTNDVYKNGRNGSKTRSPVRPQPGPSIGLARRGNDGSIDTVRRKRYGCMILVNIHTYCTSSPQLGVTE